MSVKLPPLESSSENPSPLRICIVYDRLYPWSIGGAERWYRHLAERLASDGHRITYLTTRQWPTSDEAYVPGVKVVAIAGDSPLYDRGRRRLTPVLRFGLAAWWHLLIRGDDYDAVHTSAMSSTNALAAASLARWRRFRLILDWWEVWTWSYWRRYIGPVAGAGGWLMQFLTAMLPHMPIAYSTLHASRLKHLTRHDIQTVLGVVANSTIIDSPAEAEPLIVFAGRFIPEKQVPDIIPALVLARERIPALRATLIGEGPDSDAVKVAVRSAGLGDCVELPGFVSEEGLTAILGRAMCLVFLSRREGYGLIVAEAAALGVPSVILRHPDSAATELIVEGVNGFTCATADPSEVASAILRVHDEGNDLRHATLAWFRANAGTLTIDGFLPLLLRAYRGHP